MKLPLCFLLLVTGAVRGIVESRDRGRRGGWTRRGSSADEIIGDIDIRLRSH